MKQKLLYIHGLGSDRNSRKFLDLQEYFKDDYEFDCLEWKNDDNIKQLIEHALNSLKSVQKPIVIGDSTGANFACQLRELRKKSGLETTLILTSPLLRKDYSVNAKIFPPNVADYLVEITDLTDVLVIASPTDETVNQHDVFSNNHSDAQIVAVEDNHRLLNFKSYLPVIKDYIAER